MAQAIVSYKDKYERARSALANFKEASKAPLKALLVTGGCAVGGGAAGLLNAKLPTVAGWPTVPIVGGVISLGAVVNAEEEWSPAVNSIGGTMIGTWVAQAVYNAAAAAAH